MQICRQQAGVRWLVVGQHADLLALRDEQDANIGEDRLRIVLLRLPALDLFGRAHASFGQVAPFLIAVEAEVGLAEGAELLAVVAVSVRGSDRVKGARLLGRRVDTAGRCSWRARTGHDQRACQAGDEHRSQVPPAHKEIPPLGEPLHVAPVLSAHYRERPGSRRAPRGLALSRCLEIQRGLVAALFGVQCTCAIVEGAQLGGRESRLDLVELQTQPVGLAAAPWSAWFMALA